MFINKLNHKSFSEGYIHRIMNILGITARIRRKKVNRIRVLLQSPYFIVIEGFSIREIFLKVRLKKLGWYKACLELVNV